MPAAQLVPAAAAAQLEPAAAAAQLVPAAAAAQLVPAAAAAPPGERVYLGLQLAGLPAAPHHRPAPGHIHQAAEVDSEYYLTFILLSRYINWRLHLYICVHKCSILCVSSAFNYSILINFRTQPPP